jgi:uncharacterized membrane protein
MSEKINQRLDQIASVAKTIAESEREKFEKSNVKTSMGKLAGADVVFMLAYITQLEAVTDALRAEKVVMEGFDQAIAAKDDAAIAEASQQVMEASRAVEIAMRDLDRFELILE